MSVYVEHTAALAVVHPRGGLDGYSAAGLRSALHECLAEQPVGIVVDASDLSAVDEAAVLAVAEAAHQSQRWPGSRLALAHARPSLLALAHGIGGLESITVCKDVASARLELAKLPVPPRLQRSIAPDRSAPFHARTAVHDLCLDQLAGVECDHAQLVASELVTNAVVHAGTPIVLTLRLLSGALSVAVRDGDPRPARIADITTESSERGRGLLLVDAFAASWGNFFPNSGKVVWAMVPLPRFGRVPARTVLTSGNGA